MLTKFEVGKQFPLHNRANGQELTRIDTNEAFFDVCFYSSQPLSDVQMFTKGKLKYRVYVSDGTIPIFLIELTGMQIDASINILKVYPDKVDDWLNSKANAVTLYLIDANTNILHGMRMIGLRSDVADKIRDACENQDNTFATHNEVEAKAAEISNKLTTAQMISSTTMYKL